MPGLEIGISKYHLEYEFIGNGTVSVEHQIRELGHAQTQTTASAFLFSSEGTTTPTAATTRAIMECGA